MPIKLTTSHLRYMNIGKRYWGAARESLTDHQRTCLKSYLEKLEEAIRKGIGVFLWGENNLGKSYVSALLCKLVWGQYRVTSYCVTASDLKDCWIREIPAHEGSDELMRDRVRTARFLVVDDIGKEYRVSSEFVKSNVGALLRDRVRNNLVTCFTSNLNPPKFSEVYGKSTGQLAKECMSPICLSGGEDMRDREASKIEQFLKS